MNRVCACKIAIARGGFKTTVLISFDVKIGRHRVAKQVWKVVIDYFVAWQRNVFNG